MSKDVIALTRDLMRKKKKEHTHKVAEKVREILRTHKVKARVYCIHYVDGHSLVCVSPNGDLYKQLNYAEQISYRHGLEHWLTCWVGNDLGKDFTTLAKISSA